MKDQGAEFRGKIIVEVVNNLPDNSYGYKGRLLFNDYDGQIYYGKGGSFSNLSEYSWLGSTSNSVETEIFMGGIAYSRLSIPSSSGISFNIQVVGKDNTGNKVNSYYFRGNIRRDSSNNTVLANIIKEILEEDTTWDANIYADDINEALIIKVIGQSSNTVLWSASGTISTAS